MRSRTPAFALLAALAFTACDPVEFPAPTCTDGMTILEPRDVVSGNHLALDASNVYFTVSDVGAHLKERALFRVPKRGGEQEEVLWHANLDALGNGMVVDDRVYFGGTQEGGTSAIFAVPKDGGDSELLGALPSACALSAGIALDAQHVYAATGLCPNGSVLVSVPRAGGAPTTLWSTTAGGVRWIAADEGRVFFTEGDATTTRLRSVAPDGSDLATIATFGGSPGSSGASLAVRDGHAFVILADSVVDVTIVAGVVKTLASNLRAPRSVAVDDSGVYVSAQTASGAARLIAIDPSGVNAPVDLGAPWGGAASEIVLDDTSIYATTPDVVSRTGKCSAP